VEKLIEYKYQKEGYFVSVHDECL